MSAILDPPVPDGALEPTFLRIASEYGPAFRRIAGVYAGAEGEAEDLHQEILLQLWRALPAFRGQASVGTWAYRVALNTAMKWRHRSRPRAWQQPDGAEQVASAGVHDGRREAEILREYLSALDELDRSVLLLYMEGLPQRRIGEVVGLSEAAVGVRIHRMKRAFEERYVS